MTDARTPAASSNSPRVVVEPASEPARADQVRALLREYADSIGIDLEYQGFSAELDALPSPYAPPQGALFVARVGDAVAGCVAMRRIASGVAEMKRLYVRPAFRSEGVGRRLVDAIIRAARDAGYAELRLDTLPQMSAAQALYGRLGFVEIDAYNDNHMPGTRFYSLRLRD